jgi:hypothetical protein
LRGCTNRQALVEAILDVLKEDIEQSSAKLPPGTIREISAMPHAVPSVTLFRPTPTLTERVTLIVPDASQGNRTHGGPHPSHPRLAPLTGGSESELDHHQP